jgi:hypothetical protein
MPWNGNDVGKFYGRSEYFAAIIWDVYFMADWYIWYVEGSK